MVGLGRGSGRRKISCYIWGVFFGGLEFICGNLLKIQFDVLELGTISTMKTIWSN